MVSKITAHSWREGDVDHNDGLDTILAKVVLSGNKGIKALQSIAAKGFARKIRAAVPRDGVHGPELIRLPKTYPWRLERCRGAAAAACPPGTIGARPFTTVQAAQRSWLNDRQTAGYMTALAETSGPVSTGSKWGQIPTFGSRRLCRPLIGQWQRGFSRGDLVR